MGYIKKKRLLTTLCIMGVSFLSANTYSQAELIQYKGADLVKYDLQSQSDYLLPLANLKKSARTWIPIQSQEVSGNISSSLFQFSRNESLEPIYRFYKKQLSDGNVLYECQGRTCGSSNAWANNFFNEYRLYGPDANQSLLVVESLSKETTQYHVLYLNRRGAGDVMLRIDSVENQSTKDSDEIIYQANINDSQAISQYLNALKKDESVLVLVSGKTGSTFIESYRNVKDKILTLKAGIAPALLKQITFINLANQANPAFGQNQLSVLLDGTDSTP